MFDKISYISDYEATIKLKKNENITMNLMNLHLVFEDETKKVLGEVKDINGDTVTVGFLGEIVGNVFVGGIIRKPRLDAKVRVINKNELLLIMGNDQPGYMALGTTPFYDGTPVYLDVNNFFSGHFAIMGSSGSGKSCCISRLFQNMFYDQRINPFNANIFMFDSSGEYKNALSNLNSINPRFNYRLISTNEKVEGNDKLRIPVYLLNEVDLALLLQVTNHSQISIVEKMRKLAVAFSQDDMDVDANNYKNYLIAKAIRAILYTNETAHNKRNEVFSILASCSTPQFNLDAVVQGVGYKRKFRECFLIDSSGIFVESLLLNEYLVSFIDAKYDAFEPKKGVFYTLDTLEKALEFALISEGWLRDEKTYGDAITLKVRLHSLISSENAKYFNVEEHMSVVEYLNTLISKDNKRYQFININLDNIDDDIAKVITKIFSRLILDYSKKLTDRASVPFHIVVDEAHRYIQNDNDRFLIGYNIFERIAKEGRKYGVILGIITPRPVDVSDVVISQCSNFLIFKMNHSVDVDYIRKMVPNITEEIIEKQKTLQIGTCLGVGGAFKIPIIVKMEMPNPMPWESSCNVVSYWGGGSTKDEIIVPAPMVDLNGTEESASVTDVVETVDESNKKVEDNDVVEIPTGDDSNDSSQSNKNLEDNDSDEEDDDVSSDAIEIPGGSTNKDDNQKTNKSNEKNEVEKQDNESSMKLPALAMPSDVAEKMNNDVPPVPLVSFLEGSSAVKSMIEQSIPAAPAEPPSSVQEPAYFNGNSSQNMGQMSPSQLVSFVGNSANMNDVNMFNNGSSASGGFTNMSNNIGNDTFSGPAMSNVSEMLSIPGGGQVGGNASSMSQADLVSFNNNFNNMGTNMLNGVSFGQNAQFSMNGDSGMSNNGRQFDNNSMPMIPNLPMNMLANEPPKTDKPVAKKRKFSDTFNISDLSDLNLGGQMNNNSNNMGNNMSNFAPVNNNGLAYDGFVPNVPRDMNFGAEGGTPANSGNSGEPLAFNAGSSLVSFLEQM